MPIRVENLVPYLESHPDAAFASYIHEGLCNGFRVGLDYHNATLHKRGANHPSMFTNAKVVDNRIADEVMASRLHGLLPPHLKPVAQISPMGLVPKPHQVNRFRLNMDLSHPNGGSVKDGISLRYSSVDVAVDIIRPLGRDTQLVKLDIKDAYRLIPVHPDDYHLLGISWRGETYIDLALPFGLRSAPKIFSTVADLVAWVLHQHCIKHQPHYLDSYLFLEERNSTNTTPGT